MAQRYQVTLRGIGFYVPVPGSKPIRGFLTVRRVLAESPEAAARDATAALEQEERYRSLLETTEREVGSRDGCRVRQGDIGQLSWWRWHFTSQSRSFIFFEEES